MHSDTISNRPDECLPAFIYYTNVVLRSIFTARVVSEVYGQFSIKRWLDQNRYSTCFSSQNSQALKIDPKDHDYDIAIGHDPFRDLNRDQVSDLLQWMYGARQGSIVALPTLEHHEVIPKEVYSVRIWTEILSDLGSVVQIHNASYWTLFVVLNV